VHVPNPDPADIPRGGEVRDAEMRRNDQLRDANKVNPKP